MSHLLTRLELIGFKSFADKTVLQFPHGITAVVGPNGSGKSNIIDAIRWLLGEREARNLRGGKVDDLIFAGTPKRPRVGQAQASLHFENRGRFFPVDFEEVTVTRQVSRDGVNKYLVNKAEVRLKDLIDFFAQARLGSRGITVVTQGNSDMFIRATPKERREMIEEVLGLREYQLKKTDAERRLEHTSLNLEKVEALLEEITPHLRSLKRQTIRWEKRDELEGELRALEDAFFGGQWRSLTRAVDVLEEECGRYETARSPLQKEKEEAESSMRALEENEPRERAELTVIKERVKELFRVRSEAQKELGRVEAMMEKTQTDAREHSGIDGEKIQKALEEVRDILQESLHAGYEILRDTVVEVLGHIETLLEGGRETDDESEVPAAFFEEFKKLEGSLKGFERELESLEKKEKELEHSQERFYSDFKNAIAKLERARDAIQTWEHEFQSKNIERERLTVRREELERQITQAGRKVSDFEFVQDSSQVDRMHDGVVGDAQVLERHMFRLRGELAAMGEVDETIIKEARETEERHAFLERESEDLRNAKINLKSLVKDLDKKLTVEFENALKHINKEFQRFFDLMFGGGTARLVIEKKPEAPASSTTSEEIFEEAVEKRNENDVEASGIEIKLSLPRKRLTSLEVLSGGERSLVGIAALFALISVSPPPFLVLDEIDAALDDRNTRRFAEMLKEFAKETQFIVVTHNRATMEVADVLYGVTLGEDGTSKILSMKLE